MLIKKDLESMSDGSVVETIGLIKSYDVRPTKNGGQYISGSLEMKGTVDFKIWSGSLFDELVKYDYSDAVCKIYGKVNEYNGVKSLVLSDVKAVEEGVYNKEDFFEDKYNTEAYWNTLNVIVNKNCSEKAQEIFSIVMNDGLLKERFNVEFAARSHHDAVKSGLLAHTYKVTFIMTKMLKLYPAIVQNVDTDALILGSAFHDIGKVLEYTNGSIIGNGLLVSHHAFGVELLYKYKENITELKGKEFYYRLISVIEQHHGEFGEAPRTFEAMLVHLVDCLETRFTEINENFEQGNKVATVSGFKLN